MDHLVYFNLYFYSIVTLRYVTLLNELIVSNKLLSAKLGKLIAHFTRISSTKVDQTRLLRSFEMVQNFETIHTSIATSGLTTLDNYRTLGAYTMFTSALRVDLSCYKNALSENEVRHEKRGSHSDSKGESRFHAHDGEEFFWRKRCCSRAYLTRNFLA